MSRVACFNLRSCSKTEKGSCSKWNLALKEYPFFSKFNLHACSHVSLIHTCESSWTKAPVAGGAQISPSILEVANQVFCVGAMQRWPPPSAMPIQPHGQWPMPAPLPPPFFSPSSSQPIWDIPRLRQHLFDLVNKLALLKAVIEELKSVALLKEKSQKDQIEIPADDEALGGAISLAEESHPASEVQHVYKRLICTAVFGKHVSFEEAETLARKAANDLQQAIQTLLFPIKHLVDGSAELEQLIAASNIVDRQLKMKRNRMWRKRRRQKAAELRQKEYERYEQADHEADERRAREIAKDIAGRKMDKMKLLAEKKAREDRMRLEEELELVLMVERLKELRAIRVQKLKKQGRFFPEEDDIFMERVQAAVEEEERQEAAAAHTNAAAIAIANAEAAKAANLIGTTNPTKDLPSDFHQSELHTENVNNVLQDDYKGLPPDVYRYYYGSSIDMGALIEVRRAWDTFLMPGSSRIPASWVEPSPPSDPTWASYLVTGSKKPSSSEMA